MHYLACNIYAATGNSIDAFVVVVSVNNLNKKYYKIILFLWYTKLFASVYQNVNEAV